MTISRPSLLSPENAAAYRAAFDAIRQEQSELQEQRRQIGLEMRAGGAPFREIAAALGISRSYARDLIADPTAAARRARTRIVEKRRASERL